MVQKKPLKSLKNNSNPINLINCYLIPMDYLKYSPWFKKNKYSSNKPNLVYVFI